MFSKFFHSSSSPRNPGRSAPCRSAQAAIAAAVLAAVGLLAGAASVTTGKTIYADSFTHPSKNLDGAKPTTDHGTSKVWTAGTQNRAGNGAGQGVGWTDGGYSATGSATGEAYLLFTPTSGHIYTLSAGINWKSGNGGYSSLELGFIGTPNTRADLDHSSGYAFAAIHQANALLWRSAGKVYANPVDKKGTNKVSIVLNTTAPKWTYEFTVNGKHYGPKAFSKNPKITAVGLGNGGGNMKGTFSKFSLTEAGNHLRARAAKLVKSAK